VIPRQVKVADIVWQPTAAEYAGYGQASPAASSITPAVASRF
jgi:sulfonate transport system substrate-binding protein